MRKKIAYSAVLVAAIAAGGTMSTLSQVNASDLKPKFEPVFDITAQEAWTPTAIQDKMLNAIDHYQSIKGTYRRVMKPLGEDNTVTFSVKQGVSPGSYVKVQRKDGSIVEQKSDGKVALYIDHEAKEYQRDEINQSFRKKSTAQRKMKAKDGHPVYVYRQDPAASELAHTVIFPQSFAFWINEETKELDHEQILGRDATVLQGNLSGTLSQKHDAVDFKMWIDSMTGVLLKLEERNAAGEVTNLIEVTDLKIDEEIDESKFSTKEPKEYKDKSVKKKFSK